MTPFSPSPNFPPLTWQEIHHKNYPHKVSDLLWKLAHSSLPIGPSVINISPDSIFCSHCPSTPNSIQHLFSDCPIASSLFNLTNSICNLIIPHSSFSNLITSPNSSLKHIGRLIFSSFIWTIWSSYTSRAFGYSNIPSFFDIFKLFLHILLENRSLFPSPLWPSIHQIISVINNRIFSSLPPPSNYNYTYIITWPCATFLY